MGVGGCDRREDELIALDSLRVIVIPRRCFRLDLPVMELTCDTSFEFHLATASTSTRKKKKKKIITQPKLKPP